jgi:hypothetical protein
MIDEGQIIKETIKDLTDKILMLTIRLARCENRPFDKHLDFEIDPDYIRESAQLATYTRVLGRLLNRLGNSDYSLYANRLHVSDEDRF